MANAFQTNAFQNDAFQVFDDVGGKIAYAELATVAVSAAGAVSSVNPNAGLASVTTACLTPVLANLYVNAELATVAVSAHAPLWGDTIAYAGLATVAVSAYGSMPGAYLRSSHALEYCIELYDGSGSGRGPGSKIAELWDARNIGWSRYDRLPGKAFATLYQEYRMRLRWQRQRRMQVEAAR